MSNQLPPGWLWTTVADVCLPIQKLDPRTIPNFEFEYIDIGGIDPGSGRIRQTKSLRGADAPSRARQVVRKGDVVLSTVRTYQRKVACISPDLDGAIASTGFSVLRPASGTDSKFLLYQTLSHDFISQLSEMQTGTSYPAVRDKDVRAMQIRIAPSAEQKRIVSAIEEHFSRLDAAEATLRQSLRRLDTLRSSVLAGAFHTRDDFPTTWRWSTVGDVAEVKSGIQKQPKRKPNKNPAPFLRVANVLRGELLLDEVHEIELFDGELERYRIRHGDLLVVEGNGSPAQIGRAASWSDEIDNCVHQNHLIRVSPGPNLSPKFLSLYWNAPHTASLLRDVASSTSGLYTLSTRKIKSIPIPVAPLSEQERIAARIVGQLEKQDRLRESIRYALDRVTSLRRSVLSTAFSGRLVAQDPTDEPASVLLDRIAASRPAKPGHQRRTP
ncbi:MAG: restriction endonuclease subunit S [bacterium]|nr:restriction endonuclease subunit S [bacterium]